ncbi:sulfatase-like hydrolase/transferase [Tenacibaculum sp. nBUS_03]|uniref:sulfatase-like hydrolase/transferase n=1 Tax=Tenacibaculum sp. nBUS_03 TaxID=3395320 RepID=UPI003EB9D950
MIFLDNRFVLILTFCFLIISCSPSSSDTIIQEEEQDETPIGNETTPNILFVIADDMGLDASPGYDIGTRKPQTPNLQNLINTGVRFNNVWSSPTCSPTRASILTGKYAIRNGVIKVSDVLSTSETSLHKYIESNTNSEYSSAVIGKWHLSNNENHPNNMGIDYYAGSLGGGLQSYSNWNLNINGQTEASTDYVTTKTTDLAIDWINIQTKPWFLWLAYNAPHPPFHLPPNNLHSQGVLPSDKASIDANPLPYYLAMIEAMDSEFGRLLNSLSQEEKDNTIIIFIGDNGTPNQVLQGYTRGKGTIYEGGINVPMIISGKGITRFNETEDALINVTDLFATIANIAGVSVSKLNDSKSFKSLFTTSINDNNRDYTFVEDGNDDGSVDFTIRNTTHKYMLFENGNEALFDLINDPLESKNLMNGSLSSTNSAIKNELATKLKEIKN